MPTVYRVLIVLAAIVCVPTLAAAQGSITGVVKDSSGAVLPGVSVEVSSPVLIEKVRIAVTDGTGQYRIIDLRPGTYTVTATLQGFNTVKRDGVEVTGTAVSRIDLDLQVGALEETLTITAESPIVDVQSIRRQTTVAGQVIADLPTSRSYGALFQLIPAVSGGSRDVQVTPALVVFGGPGGRGTEGRLQVEGLNVGAALSGGGVSSYIPDVGNSQEVTFSTSGGLGEAEVGGPTMNIVPKTGGNQLKGNLYLAGTPRGLVGSNYTSELQAAGLRAPGELLKLWDFTAGVGGPILKDRIWYFANVREEGSWQSVPGMYRNQNAGDPTKFIYVPDLSKQAATAGSWRIAGVRLTMQPASRHRFNVFWDEQHPCQGSTWQGNDNGCRQQGDDEWIIGGAPGSAGSFGLATATQAPEISNYAGRGHAYQRVTQATWTSPFTNRLLLDGGMGTYFSHYGGQEMPGNPTRAIPRMVEQCAGAAPANAVSNACAHGISEPDVRIAGLVEQSGLRAQLARLGVVRHRRAQHEVRVSGRVSPDQSELLQQRQPPHLPVELRRPEPADHGPQAVRYGSANEMGSALRTGAVDDESADRCRARCVTTMRGATSRISRSDRCGSCRPPLRSRRRTA